jgi:hypothetical protein
MPLRRAGLSNYYFIWNRQIQPGNRSQFLSQFKNDPSAMYDLRRILAETFPGISLAMLTDDQVLAGIAKLTAAGELVIAREDTEHGGSATQPVAGQQGPPPASTAQPSSSSKSQAPESPSLPSNTDPASQAGALAEAAAMGAGVCPYCTDA